MKPEDLAQDRPIRTVLSSGPADILFDAGADALLKMRNTRGCFEVLATADRARDFLASASLHSDLELTGFWRRRSGFHSSGERHFIWTLVLISWSDASAQPLAA